jgi:hypothetical protein
MGVWYNPPQLQQLMSEQYGFGKDKAESIWSDKRDHGDNQMDEKEENVAHP